MSRKFRFTQFVYTVRNIPNRICETASIEKKNWSRSRSLEYAERGHFTLLFCHLCKQRQRNEQKTKTHAYTANVLVLVAVVDKL